MMLKYLPRLAAVSAGLLFLFSAVAKMLPIEAFELALSDQGIATGFAGRLLARFIIGFELFLGFTLLQTRGLRKIWLPLAFGTVTIFTAHLIWLMISKTGIENCGCMGALISFTPIEGALKNLLTLGVLAFGWLKFPEEKQVRAAWPVLVIFPFTLALTFMLFPIQFKTQPESPVAVEFAAFTEFENGHVANLLEGRKMVAVFSLDCDHCKEAAEMLAVTQNAEGLPGVYCLFYGEPEKVAPFLTATGLQCHWKLLETADFFNLLEQAPPRVVSLNDGQIVEEWVGNFMNELPLPDPEEI